MRDMMWGKLVGQLLEEGIRVVGELEKEFAKQAEQAKANQSAQATEVKKAPVETPTVEVSLQKHIAENLVFQGYEVDQDKAPNLINISEKGNPIAYMLFFGDKRVFIEPVSKDAQAKVIEATALITRLKDEMLVALQANCSDEIVMKTALDLTDAYVGEKVAKEDVEAFNRLFQVLTSLMAGTQGTH